MAVQATASDIIHAPKFVVWDVLADIVSVNDLLGLKAYVEDNVPLPKIV